jgi:hypothetical protein
MPSRLNPATAGALVLLASTLHVSELRAQQPDSIPGLYSDFRHAPRPRAPLTIDRVCPFECCQYGDWILREPALLRRRPSPTAPVVARLRAGQHLSSDSGFMRIDTVGVVAVQKDYVDGMYHTPFHRGDTLLVLDYVGEGQYNAWWRGYAIMVETFWDGPRQEPDSLKTGKIVQLQSSTWWVRARDARARRGWLDMNRVSVRGADACS